MSIKFKKGDFVSVINCVPKLACVVIRGMVGNGMPNAYSRTHLNRYELREIGANEFDTFIEAEDQLIKSENLED